MKYIWVFGLRIWLASSQWDKWSGDDKFAHYGLGGMLWCAMQVYAVDSLLIRAVAFVALCALWELFENVRFDRWTEGTGEPIGTLVRKQRWLFACDAFSWRDVVADCLGALTVGGLL